MPRTIDSVRVLRVSVTDVCNLRCVYCMPSEPPCWLPRDQILDYEEIVEVVRAAVAHGVRAIKLTGGEPLARRDLHKLLALLAPLKGRGIDDLSLTTNGTLLAGLARTLKDNGLDRLTVSLDTLDPAKFRTVTNGGVLAEVWSGIEAAREAGFDHPKINVVVMRGINEDEIPDFARLTLERPVTVRFIEYMPLGRAAVGRDDAYVPADEILSRMAPLGAPAPAGSDVGSGPAKLFRLPGAPGKIGLIAAMSRPFCESCNRLRLTADGHLRSCLFEGGEVDVRPALRPVPDLDALMSALEEAVRLKPAEHGCVGHGQMSRIGG